MFFFADDFLYQSCNRILSSNTVLSKARPAWPTDSYAKKLNPDLT